MASLVKAAILVDWHSAERVVKEIDPIRVAARGIRYCVHIIQDQVARMLKEQDSATRFRATIRLYHGWHSKREPTSVRTHFEKLWQSGHLKQTIGNVSFAPEIQFGNVLACGTARNPLYDTNRSHGQKMVDTAIASDLLYILRTGRADIAIVVAEDDDMLPPLFTAEAWGLNVILLRSRAGGFVGVSDTDAGKLLSTWRLP